MIQVVRRVLRGGQRGCLSISLFLRIVLDEVFGVVANLDDGLEHIT